MHTQVLSLSLLHQAVQHRRPCNPLHCPLECEVFFNPQAGGTKNLPNCAGFHGSGPPKLVVLLSLGFSLRESGALRCSQRGVNRAIEGCKHKHQGLSGYLCARITLEAVVFVCDTIRSVKYL